MLQDAMVPLNMEVMWKCALSFLSCPPPVGSMPSVLTIVVKEVGQSFNYAFIFIFLQKCKNPNKNACEKSMNEKVHSPMRKKISAIFPKKASFAAYFRRLKMSEMRPSVLMFLRQL